LGGSVSQLFFDYNLVMTEPFLLNYYQTLRVQEHAEDVVIHAAYQALFSHYSKNALSINKELSLIQEAYAILGDPTKRAQYDLLRFRTSPEKTIDSILEARLPVGNIEEQAWEVLITLYPQLGQNLNQLEASQAYLAQSYRGLILEFISEHLVHRVVTQLSQEIQDFIDVPSDSEAQSAPRNLT